MSRQSAVLSLEVPDEERPDLPLAWLRYRRMTR